MCAEDIKNCMLRELLLLFTHSREKGTRAHSINHGVTMDSQDLAELRSFQFQLMGGLGEAKLGRSMTVPS